MKKQYHFVGIGGIGMGALASLLLDKGYAVTGSDVKENQVIANLRLKGAKVTIGHAAQNIEGADCVIFSSAIRSDNPEMTAAQARGVVILQRAKLLAELMEDHVGITIAGAHGKTTTTSMISRLLIKAGLQPTTAVGGIVNGVSAHARLGAGRYFVAEVDESDGSFLYFSPKYSVITNIDFEHVDYYHTWDNILEAYRKFIGRTSCDGMIIACGDDPRLSELVKGSARPFQTYGLSSHNDLLAQGLHFNGKGMSFDCVRSGKNLGRISLNVPGDHNAVNALACVAVGLNLGIDFGVIQSSLNEYTGVERRFQLKGDVDNIWVVDDYGHHPNEIRATLQAARQMNKERVVVIFQPHRYSRVHHLFEDMADSLTNSDYLILTDIYAASEQPIEGVNAENLCHRVRQKAPCPVVYLKKDQILGHVLDIVRPGDLVLTLGAGDITHLGDEIVRALDQGRHAHAKQRLSL